MVSIDYLTFYVNGKEIVERHPDPSWTVLWYLRNKLRLTGSKIGCGEGGCGACTVLVSESVDPESGEIEHRSVNACLAPLCSINGCHVVTVEGLGSLNKSNLHVTQTRLAELFASQCGFCTPGIVMSLYGHLKSKSLLTLDDIEDAFDGNLCRCTGYRPVLDAAKTFVSDIDKLPNKTSSPHTSTTFDKCLASSQENSSLLDSIQFPEKLKNFRFQSVHIKSSSIDWHAPTTIAELLELRRDYPGTQSKLIFGNTQVQIERRYQQMQCSRLISISRIDELKQCQRTDDALIFGAGITFSKLKTKLTEWKEDDNGFCEALLDQMKYFASTQIRNVASLGGNIITASSTSDINPILQAAGALVELRSFAEPNGRKIALSDFFLGNQKIQMNENEILFAVHIPLNKNSETKTFIRSYKQAQRREDSKGIVSAGFRVELKKLNDTENEWQIVSLCFSFGGMASCTITAKLTQEKLTGSIWSKTTINQAYDMLLQEISLDDMSPGGRIAYRRTLIQTFLFKFYAYVCQQLNQPAVDLPRLSKYRGISHGQQTVPEPPSTRKVVGTSISHRSAYLQATGEATFVDDMPSVERTLHGALVLSDQPHALIKNINIEQASKVSGFVSYVSHTDVPGENYFNTAFQREELFASSTVLSVGQIIGLVVAETDEAAQIAARLIKIEYEPLSPVILSIDDAIVHNSFYEQHELNQGDVEKAFADADHTVEDEVFVGGQEHFYMEPNACMVIPSNDDQEIHVYAGSQGPSAVQESISSVLKRDSSRIVCHTKRIGGGFGGKESRATPFILTLAVAATKLERPVRMRLDRNIDFASTGHRHPFKAKYKVAFNKDGQLTGLDVKMWSNAGYSLDLSGAVIQCAMLHLGNSYRIPNMRIQGFACKTNLPSNTAFRGFGGPQALWITENIIEHVAWFLQQDSLKIRQLNLFQEGDATHYGQTLELWHVPRIINELIETSEFEKRKVQVSEFNRTNPYRKRGINLIPVKFGIGFLVRFLNQAGALVHIYKDGSVVVTHGGIEIGQGLHTKMIAIAAEALGCDVKFVRISETATDKIHNASSTGGSVTADLNGMAVKNACEQLRQRLDTLLTDENRNIPWQQLVVQAYFSGVDLCARGFYYGEQIFDLDFSKNRAQFNYFTQGAAVTEVELDVLTGDWFIVRTDILIDVGTSLNPYIDIGQIEGAFMQGVGLFTMEELIWGDDKNFKWVKYGHHHTLSPDTYKIPSANDIPVDFRVSLLSGSKNPRAVYSSKGVGEPPTLLGATAFFALKQACLAYREEQGLKEYLTLNSPATVERLRMSCVDEFTRRVCSQESKNEQVKASY